MVAIASKDAPLTRRSQSTRLTAIHPAFAPVKVAEAPAVPRAVRLKGTRQRISGATNVACITTPSCPDRLRRDVYFLNQNCHRLSTAEHAVRVTTRAIAQR